VVNAPGCTSASAAYCTLPLDVSTLTTIRLPRDPGSQKWNYVNLLVQVNIRMEQQLPSRFQQQLPCRFQSAPGCSWVSWVAAFLGMVCCSLSGVSSHPHCFQLFCCLKMTEFSFLVFLPSRFPPSSFLL
jgi:hypothetical protein